MGRLSHKDEQLVMGLVEESQTIRLAKGAFWPQFLPLLNDALRARVPLAYGLRLTKKGPEVAFVETVGEVFKPRDAMSLWKNIGVENHDQIRLRFWKEDGLLAWVGALRPADQPFTDRERLLLRRLAPALHKRLTLEHQLLTAPLARAALETAIEALPRAAMVVNRRGEPHFANALARRRLRSDPSGLTATLLACIGGKSLAFALTHLEVVGAPRRYLAVEVAQPRDARPVLGAASRRWALTPRETEVLHRLSEGLSNRAIAQRLSCAQRTVEVHVARLLSKSESASRSELIARFWSEPVLNKSTKGLHAHP